MMNEELVDKLLHYAEIYGMNLITALITLLVGLYVIKLIRRTIDSVLQKRNIDSSLRPFLVGILDVSLKLMLVIAVIGMIGVQTSSFLALLGTAGIAIGMALSGTLQNFAGGVVLLILKPFKAGDFIEAQGFTGRISEIRIFNTILKTTDNKTVIIPNGALSNGSIINYTMEETRRVDFTVGISYDSDMDKAKALVKELIDKNELILREPEPFVDIINLNNSSVDIVMRVWTKTENYWSVYFYLPQNIKKSFDANGIEIPFPHTQVVMKNQN
jgi:small conductance mechanosensitive channel